MEVVTDCHEFDPFPPLPDPFVASSDKVTRDKREIGYDRPVVVTGAWSSWSSCGRARSQIRSQTCEYGRNIEKRQCAPQYPPTPATFAQPTYLPQAQAQYPPNPYVHPSSQSEEYARRMAEHDRQMEDSCCYKLQQLQISLRQAGITGLPGMNGLQVHPAVPSASPCPRVCPPARQLPQAAMMPPAQFVTPPSYRAWSNWATWSVCSASCGSGVQTRSRSCDGVGCPGMPTEQRTCELRPCNMWSEWCEWSPCRATCGIGEKTRTRYCELGTNRCEGPDFEVSRCDAGPCPEWSSWSDWTSCSASCGGGTMQRYRSCSNGYCPGESVEQQQCALEPCACWSEWGPFTSCSISCGSGGVMSRRRTCIGGNYCPGEPVEEVACTTPAPCPEWTEWEDWSQCSVTCGHGTLTRQRTCLGGYCPGDRIESVPCDLPPCSFWGQWQEWSACTATCGDGMKHRKRVCQYGTECPGTDEESLFCYGPPCSAWTEWGEWSRCSADCGPGQKSRERECRAADRSPSEDCLGLKLETVLCNERACCHWTEWCAWSNCDRECGGGKMSRERFCQRPGFEGEEDPTCSCPGPKREDRDCNQHACAPQCQWTAWCPWSPCSAADPCQAGISSRSRQCVGEAGCNCYGFAEETNSCRAEDPCLVPQIQRPSAPPC